MPKQDAKTPLEIARQWMDAAARCDLEAIAAGMSEDCKRLGEANWMSIGKHDYVTAYAGFLESFSEYRLEILNAMVDGRTVVFEMIESARMTGPYKLPDGTVVQPSNKSYTDHVCTWIEVADDGLISEIRAYIPSTRGTLIAEAIALNPT